MRRHAAERGYAVEHVLTEVHTGTELWERPQLTKLRALVRARAVDVVVAYSIDRLSRDPVHLGVVLSEAEHAGVEVEFVTEPLDHSPEGQLIRFVRGYAAKVEHEKIRERTVRGKRARVLSGKITGARRPLFGYRFTADRCGYEVDEATAPIVRRVFADVLSGRSLRGICRDLMAEGVPTPGQSERGIWTAMTIRSIVTNTAYEGRLVSMARTWVKENGKRVVRRAPAEAHVVQPASVCPPVVAPGTVEAAAARLVHNGVSFARRIKDPTASLLRGGYVRCALCGWAMYFMSATGGHSPRYGCPGRHALAPPCGRQTIGAVGLDAAVWAKVAAVLSRPEVIAAELERLDDEEPGEVDTAAVDRTLTGVRRQIRVLVEQMSRYDPGSEVAKAVDEKLAQLEMTAKRLEAERAAIEARQARHLSKRDRLSGAAAFCRRFAESLETMGYEERRQALYMLDVRVSVWPVGHPDRPADADRYVVEASVPVDLPQAAADSVASILLCATQNTVRLAMRWPDRTLATQE